ncbi:MAG: hypothetical protein ACE5HE_11215, partial [Phycisphaerae bacterium]
VRNPELVRQKLDTAVNFLKTRLTASGQMLIVSPADVKAKGFRTITHPAVAMYVAPVVGVSGEWLYIGTSASAINKCLDVAAGREPSIRSCSRFRQQALIPNGPVRSASFSDKSDLGQRLSGVAAIIGTVGGMAAAGMPDDHPDSRKLKQLLRSLLAVVMKLRPALQMIDFYDCESSVTTFDGVTLREDRVVNFKGLISGEAPQTVNAPCRVRH